MLRPLLSRSAVDRKETRMTSTVGKWSQSDPSAATCRKRNFSTSADAWRRHGGPKGRPSMTVHDSSQGVQLATMQELARYWATDYDWRRVEAKLNALPQFKTEIDGVDIHFIHVKSDHEDALPLIITHGWPGSII